MTNTITAPAPATTVVETEVANPPKVKLTKAEADQARALANARKMIAHYKKIEDEAKAILTPKLGDIKGTIGMYRSVPLIKVGTGSNGRVNEAELIAGWPEAYDACYHSKPYTTLNVL